MLTYRIGRLCCLLLWLGVAPLAESQAESSSDLNPDLNLVSSSESSIDKQLSNPDKEPGSLPLGLALDSEGNLIAIPQQFEAALEYESAPLPKASRDSKPTKSRKKKASKPRRQVADDPSCRWLDKRMKELERRLRQKDSHTARFLQAELGEHQQQFRCLKCSGSGPETQDYSRCTLYH
ncbi:MULTISPECIES: hypothetical protein [Shewanella]|uniref:Uncharacterized protein n=2 Tax=Unclassified Bacteria TaxID=49928 RepID=A0AAU6VQV2_UNCXX|nr:MULTISPECIES: hypothetical protein [Shewanella]MCT8980633.1 hypothetical protein [Shewanella algae]MDE0564954.1 hypothetical protein [Shewanella sp. K8]